MSDECNELRARAEKAEANLASTQIAWENWKVFHSTTRLEVELETARADAARYRFLKAHYASEGPDGDVHIHYACDFDRFNDLDGSIDAEIRRAVTRV